MTYTSEDAIAAAEAQLGVQIAKGEEGAALWEKNEWTPLVGKTLKIDGVEMLDHDNEWHTLAGGAIGVGVGAIAGAALGAALVPGSSVTFENAYDLTVGLLSLGSAGGNSEQTTGDSKIRDGLSVVGAATGGVAGAALGGILGGTAGLLADAADFAAELKEDLTAEKPSDAIAFAQEGAVDAGSVKTFYTVVGYIDANTRVVEVTLGSTGRSHVKPAENAKYCLSTITGTTIDYNGDPRIRVKLVAEE